MSFKAHLKPHQYFYSMRVGKKSKVNLEIKLEISTAPKVTQGNSHCVASIPLPVTAQCEGTHKALPDTGVCFRVDQTPPHVWISVPFKPLY